MQRAADRKRQKPIRHRGRFAEDDRWQAAQTGRETFAEERDEGD